MKPLFVLHCKLGPPPRSGIFDGPGFFAVKDLGDN